MLHGPNLWPAQIPELRDLALQWIERCQEVGIVLLRAWAESLGAPAGGFFDDAFADPDPLLKIARYPGHDRSVTGQGVGSHKDVGVLTLLYPEPGSTGFQVEHEAPGSTWRRSPAASSSTSGGTARAGHRRLPGGHRTPVLPPAPGTDRISLPFFLNPGLDQALPTVPLPSELAAAARGVGTDEHGGTLHSVYGLNALKSRLRAHPNVTERYHAELSNSPVLSDRGSTL